MAVKRVPTRTSNYHSRSEAGDVFFSVGCKGRNGEHTKLFDASLTYAEKEHCLPRIRI